MTKAKFNLAIEVGNGETKILYLTEEPFGTVKEFLVKLGKELESGATWMLPYIEAGDVDAKL